jgi:predicted kinase
MNGKESLAAYLACSVLTWNKVLSTTGMEAIIFCGLQASGKTTYYAQHFVKTHFRISLDLLHTRNKEHIFLQACLTTGQAFVVDNTNPAPEDRRRYIEQAKAFRFRVVGYFFYTLPAAAIQRDARRAAKEQIPVPGIYGTYKKLQPLKFNEGFDELFWVEIRESHFVVTSGEWQGE